MNINTFQNKKNELNFWVMPNAGFHTWPILKPFIREYENTHPGIKVRLSIHPWSLAWDHVMDVIKGRYTGPQPDIIQVGTTHVATLAYLGAIDHVPETGVFPFETEKSTYVWDPGSTDESGQELYCLPWFIDLRVLYYRRDIFQKLNLDPRMLQDWKGFNEICKEIKRFVHRGGPIQKILGPLAISGQIPVVLMHDLAPWIWEAGGDFCSEDLLKPQLDDPAAFKGCEYFFNLINQGFMPLSDNTIPQGNFFTGHYAMQFSGSWPIKTYLKKDWFLCDPEVVDGFDAALYPAGPHGRYTFLGGSNLAVASGSSQKDLAWEFVKFLSEPNRQMQHATAIGALPPRLAGMEELFKGYSNIKKVFWDSVGHARRLPRLVELGSIDQIISKMTSKLLSSIRSKEYTPRKLLEELSAANQAMNSVLSLHRYGVKPAENQQ